MAAPVTGQVGDPKLLRRALDPAAVLPSLSKFLGLAPGSASLEAERTHFSERRPVTLLYRVRHGEGAVAPVLGELIGDDSKAYAESERRRLGKMRRGRLKAGGAPFIEADPGLGLVFRAPGLDAKLPGLRLLHDNQAACDAVARALGLSPRGLALKVSLRAHRLGKRAVLQFDMDGARHGRVFGRLRPTASDSGEFAFRRHAEIAAALGRVPAIRIPEPLLFDAPLGAAFYAALPGTPPSVTGRSGIRMALAAASALDALVRHGPADAGPYGANDELDLLATWVARVWAVFPDLAEPAEQAFAAIRDAFDDLEESECVPCHRDFHEKQLMIDSRGIGVLDFDTYRLADPALDAGNLLAHLRLLAISEGRDVSDAWDAFRGAVAGRVGGPNLSAWIRAALLRLACINVFTSRRAGLAEALIRAAAR